jgi:hypothetical protein
LGGHPHWYFVPYQEDLQAALDALRAREFAAGRYNPVVPFVDCAEGALLAQGPGSKHPSIDAAVAAAGENGTRSILDVVRVGPVARYGTAAPFPAGLLVKWYGTATPTHAQLSGNLGLLGDLGRGQSAYVIVHADGAPSEILFVTRSVDID